MKILLSILILVSATFSATSYITPNFKRTCVASTKVCVYELYDTEDSSCLLTSEVHVSGKLTEFSTYSCGKLLSTTYFENDEAKFISRITKTGKFNTISAFILGKRS